MTTTFHLQDETSFVRRSSRRSKKHEFAVGDEVQIHEKTTDRILHGRLLSKAVESTALNPKWLVSFTDEAWADQEAYESSFLVTQDGSIERAFTQSPTSTLTVDNIDVDSNFNNAVVDPIATPISSRALKRDMEQVVSVSPDNSNNEGTDGESDATVKKARKTVTFDAAIPLPTSMSLTPITETSKKLRAAALARRERSKSRRQRRQVAAEQKRRSATAKLRGGNPSPGEDIAKGSTASKRDNNDETVVRVPMLTGTLLLYKGSHPRAKFIRHV